MVVLHLGLLASGNLDRNLRGKVTFRQEGEKIGRVSERRPAPLAQRSQAHLAELTAFLQELEPLLGLSESVQDAVDDGLDLLFADQLDGGEELFARAHRRACSGRGDQKQE
jgi:hypothetical protein